MLASTAVADWPQTAEYRLPLLKEDRPVSQPVNTWVSSFEIPPAVRFAAGRLELHYRYSAAINKGGVTVLLNDQPLVTEQPSEKGLLALSLPPRLLHQGENELTIYSRQQSFDIPCGDVDNKANWLKFLKGSTLVLTTQHRAPYPLMSYPFPFLNGLTGSPVQSTFVLSKQPKDGQIDAALSIASDWGRRMPDRCLRFTALLGRAPSKGNAVSIGAASAIEPEGISAVARNGYSVLRLRGMGFESLLATLGNEERTSPLAKPSAAKSPAKVSEPQVRLGGFTITDIGFKKPVALRGAFRRDFTFVFYRPGAVPLRSGTIRIPFRHAAALSGKSQLSLTVNRTPIASVALNSSNERGGVLEGKLPLALLQSNAFTVEISAYHDVANVDCSKDNGSVAWTVIEPSASIDLDGDGRPEPYLEGFPQLLSPDGTTTGSSMSFPANPSEEALALGLTIAGKAGQNNRTSIPWKSDAGGANILIGTFKEDGRTNKLDLFVAPTAEGKPRIKEGIELSPSTLEGAVVIQSAFQDDRIQYVVLASDTNALRRFNSFLATPRSTGVYMGGALCVFTREGKLVRLATKQTPPRPLTVTDTLPSQTRLYIVGGIFAAFLLMFGFLKVSGR